MMMARQRGMPKTFGEGLQAIGEALVDRSYYNKTLADEQGSRAYEAGKTGNIAEPEAPVVAPYCASGSRTGTAGQRRAGYRGGARSAGVRDTTRRQLRSSWLAFATRPADPGSGLGCRRTRRRRGRQSQNESGPNILPTGVVGDSGTAFGAAQWRHDRYANLNNFAKANGMDPRTTEAQQAFMRHELMGSGEHGGGSEAKAYRALTATPGSEVGGGGFRSNL